MPTPFNTTAAADHTSIIDATDAQIAFIVKLLAERQWNGAAQIEQVPSYVARVSSLRLVITWAMNIMDDATPPAVSRMINSTVGRAASHGVRVNAIFAYLADQSLARHGEVPAQYKPLTKAGASKLIEWLTSLPREAVEFIPQDDTDANVAVALGRDDYPTAADVPAGRYAVETEDGATNGLAFYKVDRPDTGRWAGFVFVKHMVSDDELAVRGPAKLTILRKIAEVGAEAASARYGHEIGACGVCGRTLTNDESRARGIGPVCADKAGW